jgi:prepilin-type N-terminal cleavage/methylation domain-containing protein
VNPRLHSRRIPPWSRNNSRGFTLVEVLVAATVFAVVFLTIVTLFARATTGFAGARLLTATMLAQTAMEEALSGESPDSKTWTSTANSVIWEVQRTVDRTSGSVWTIRITVKRQSDGKVYATLWTQAYRASQ